MVYLRNVQIGDDNIIRKEKLNTGNMHYQSGMADFLKWLNF